MAGKVVVASVFLVAVALCLSHAAAQLPLGTTKVSTTTYNNLVNFAHYASAAYLTTCTTIQSGSVVAYFTNSSTDTQLLLAVDSVNKQIIVSFRGSTSEEDFYTDAEVLQTGYSSPISGAHCLLCEVHKGFFGAWQSVQNYVQTQVRALHSQHPSFSIVVTGHSLGGGITPFAALAVKGLGLGVPVYLYSYGEPRVGNPFFANFVDSQIGTGNSFRGTHTNDTVPQLIPQSVFYNHHSTEYYQYEDPSSISYTAVCVGQEDIYCDDLNVLTIIDTLTLFGNNSPHHTYFGVPMGDTC